MQPPKQWFGTGSFWCLNYNPSRIVLHSLQLVDRRAWGTMQQSIAVVNSG